MPESLYARRCRCVLMPAERLHGGAVKPPATSPPGSLDMKNRIVAAAILFCLGMAVAIPVRAQTPIVIKGGTIVDVRTGKLVPDAVVVLQGDKITSVSTGAASVPPAAQ